MSFPGEDSAGTSDPGAGADGAEASNYESGFDSSEASELLEDMPQDGAASADGAAGAGPGEGQQAPAEGQQTQQPGTQQAQPQQPSQQAQAEQVIASNLNSEAPLDQLLMALSQNEEAVVKTVAQQMFKLSDKDREALENDAPAALPELGARIYVKSLQAATALVRNMVPQMLMTEMNKYNALNSVEQAFFSHFPELNKLQHGQDIVAVGQALKAQNPQMHPADLLQRVASAVMGMHGIQRGARRPQGNGRQAFRPAQSGSHMGQSSLESESPFAGLGLDFGE